MAGTSTRAGRAEYACDRGPDGGCWCCGPRRVCPPLTRRRAGAHTGEDGTPLTIYLLGSWLGNQFPLLKNSHAGGHLWNDLTGWTGDPHLSPFHLASYAAIGGGFWLITSAWHVLHEAAQHEAAQHDRLATTGPYCGYATRSTTASSSS